MDKQVQTKQAQDNRANQLNPNDKRNGPGRPAGWQGNNEKAAMDNKANQQNPNHKETKESPKKK